MAAISKKKKNITLDDLAGIMQGGFIKVEKNFIKDERLTKIEIILLEDHRKRIGRLEEQMQALQASFR